eukprot:TRINITY_DN8170_c0_g1_i3.p3 TRINITY_DN8170_c0_g1~~TRINITY_DN8170_c0_g1_i3.p3  ORF type:complete len:182 (+),score=14.25 TRINITY_DN8170_c0_g1_i3:1060-1605(+)
MQRKVIKLSKEISGLVKPPKSASKRSFKFYNTRRCQKYVDNSQRQLNRVLRWMFWGVPLRSVSRPLLCSKIDPKSFDNCFFLQLQKKAIVDALQNFNMVQTHLGGSSGISGIDLSIFNRKIRSFRTVSKVPKTPSQDFGKKVYPTEGVKMLKPLKTNPEGRPHFSRPRCRGVLFFFVIYKF